MTIRTMPLAGVKPTRKSKQFDREEAEERAFRMLSEGVFFLSLFRFYYSKQ